MLEELCRSDFFHLCKEEDYKTPLVAVKNKPWKKESEFENFFSSRFAVMDWSCIPIEKATRARRDSTIILSWHYFNDNSVKLCNSFIYRKYNGSLANAMRVHGTFENLFDCFKIDFAERKAKFMEKESKEVAEVKSNLLKRGKTPQSHGGVANLLKVLTKTMHDQGSTIYSIAKMQYAVCVQAGIFLPDEFLTDVLVAEEMLNEIS